MSPIYEPEMRERYGLRGYMHNWKHKTMDFNQAMAHIKRAFLELENSGPISRGDNLTMLYDLTHYQRKRFVALRHEFSKLAVKSQPSKKRVIGSFTGLLPKAAAMNSV